MIGDEIVDLNCSKSKRRVRIQKSRWKQISRLKLMAEFEGYSRGVTMSRGDKMSTIDGVRAGLLKNGGYSSCSCHMCRIISKMNKAYRKSDRQSRKIDLNNELKNLHNFDE